jgi:hypothetical protein
VCLAPSPASQAWEQRRAAPSLAAAPPFPSPSRAFCHPGESPPRTATDSLATSALRPRGPAAAQAMFTPSGSRPRQLARGRELRTHSFLADKTPPAPGALDARARPAPAPAHHPSSGAAGRRPLSRPHLPNACLAPRCPLAVRHTALSQTLKRRRPRAPRARPRLPRGAAPKPFQGALARVGASRTNNLTLYQSNGISLHVYLSARL